MYEEQIKLLNVYISTFVYHFYGAEIVENLLFVIMKCILHFIGYSIMLCTTFETDFCKILYHFTNILLFFLSPATSASTMRLHMFHTKIILFHIFFLFLAYFA